MEVSVLVTLEEVGDVSKSCEGDRDMVPCAEVVVKAAEKLINVGKQRAQTSSDKEFQSQMSSACELLDLSSSSLYVASQRLSVDDSQDARSKVVQAAKDVLVVSDDAEIRKIINVAKLVETNTNRLNTVVTMQELISCFKNFTDSAALLTTLANKRQKDLSHDRQREKIIMALNLLKKSIPTVSVAMQSYVKYPNNPQAQTSKMYVIKQLLSAIKDIRDAVENKFVEEDYLDVEEPGFFVSRIDQLIEALSVENRVDLHEDTENWTESVTRHSMLVAHLCTDEFKDKIIKTCQRMLQLKSRVLHLSVTMKLNPDIEKIREDFEETCEILIDESCELEKNVNLALLHLVVEVFKETTEPLERLVKAAMYTQEFECHADKMCQIASFAAASSSDAQRVRAIRSGVSHLEHLDPDIGPAAFAMAKNSKDKMAVRHVKLLMKQWSFELNNLVQVLDEMTDPGMFIHVSEEKVKEDVSTCRGFIMTCDESGISLMCRSMIGRARRVCQVAERIIENHHDAVYRNGLLVYVKQLQKGKLQIAESDDNMTTAKVIAGSAYSSGAIGRAASPRLVVQPDSQQIGGTDFMPAKVDIRSVHEELLQVTGYAAAKYLEKEAEKWEDECNPIVQVAKEMSQQMQHMAEYCKGGDGPLDLSILANVQMSSPEDRNADKILEQNAQNLMKVVMQTLNAAEAVCIKGLKAPVGDTTDEVNAIILATQWQKKLLHQRKVEADQAERDNLGLRRIEEYKPPMLTQIFNRKCKNLLCKQVLIYIVTNQIS
ncbi:hypothetical protein KUTeg_009930 [Tegillarca granosa]|uniref:Vinculin n=1 Tax=Tegillarca granosa TaxID=220873 RepID=A0ABQ9F8C4_TEGGR|nr:hypothetical protein KUTeg_009930 [Tegillarca granosa]